MSSSDESLPLHRAIESRDEILIRKLLEQGANPNEESYGAMYAIEHAISQELSVEIIADLLTHGADPEGSEWFCPLNSAAEYGRTDVIEVLLKAIANPNVVENDKWEDTALTICAEKSNARGIKLLLEHGADPSISNRVPGKTPLQIAQEKNDKEIVALLSS